MKKLAVLPALLGLSLLSACATYPTGPSVMAMPGRNKTLDQFQMDDSYCRNYAFNMNGGASASQNASNSGVESAAVGTALGAAAGALLGGHQGAATGAGAGLLVGSMAGVNAANASGQMTQNGYDQSYVQCMYAKGDRVPVYGYQPNEPSYRSPYAPPDYYRPPPPPPGWN